MIIPVYFTLIKSGVLDTLVDPKWTPMSSRTKKNVYYYYNEQDNILLPDYINDPNMLVENIENTYQLCDNIEPSSPEDIPPNWTSKFAEDGVTKLYYNKINGIETENKPSILMP